MLPGLINSFTTSEALIAFNLTSLAMRVLIELLVLVVEMLRMLERPYEV
jgi:hypothetical protein